jgi:phosphate-selective porin OprO and OprP
VVDHVGSVNRSGYWAQAMYMTELGLQPVVKYESFDPNLDTDNDINNIITFGVNYFFNDWTRLQLNYLYKAEETEISNDEFLMQLQVKF